MEELKTVGRPTKNDPKVKPPSYRLKQSTVEKIDELAERLGKKRSDVMQEVIENGLNILEFATNRA